MRYERANADLETANRLRRRVAQSAPLPPSLTVEAAVSAVMCTLVERLTAGEAHRVLDTVPDALRPLFERCVLHRDGRPTAHFDLPELLSRVGEHLGVTPAHAELVCAAVFSAVRAELPEDVVVGVAAQLPHGMKRLWLSPPLSAPDLDASLRMDEGRRVALRDIGRYAELPPQVSAAEAFSAVMCALSRRLSGGEARNVVLALPVDLRPLVESCALHRGEHGEVFGRTDLVRDVAEHLGVGDANAERVIREVIRATKRVLPQNTVADVSSQLSVDLRELWEEA